MQSVTIERRRVRIRGAVQGVGFRPYVRRLALELGLAGWVLNDGAGVFAAVQGPADAVEAFCRRVGGEAGAAALVEQISWAPLAPRHVDGFSIAGSDEEASSWRPGPEQPPLDRPDGSVGPDAPSGPDGPDARHAPDQPRGEVLPPVPAPPDVATCGPCLAELADPAGRRHRHPFVSCSACGPRFTVMTALPYDRARTTMAGFGLCEACRNEYLDPADRRFHAQIIACHDCGPVLELVEAVPGPAMGQHALEAAREAAIRAEPALARAREILAAGGIVAVKGVGGYHLACDATDGRAVARLRQRKQRGDKPFAVLVADLPTAREIADVDDVEAGLLTSGRRPVVLLRRAGRPSLAVAPEVAPRNHRLGLLLPPSALHVLLLGLPGDVPGPRALVLTSGNLAGEPIVTDDDEAVRRLSGIADAWLRHDRPVHVPCDDSVSRLVAGVELPVRRPRGHAPLPVALPFEVAPVLATGGDLKNTCAVAAGRYAWLSQHVGDLDDLATQDALTASERHLEELTGVRPGLLVADAHPGYRSSAWALHHAAGRPVRRVQHHHAHVASVMGEHGLGLDDTVIGVAFDGTGFGTDGAVWGGEVLVGGYKSFRRAAHLAYVPLAGGDASVRRPYRMAMAHLRAAGVPWDDDLPAVAACPDDERRVLAHQLATGFGCVPTSSMGRLFDAVSSLVGVRHVADYAAEAAIRLESLARALPDATPYEFGIGPSPTEGPCLVDAGTVVRAVVADLRKGVSVARIAAGFHAGVARLVADLAERERCSTGLDVVALGGGVFQNGLLLGSTVRLLEERGFTVLRPR